jgi:hypothetical protein
MSERAAALLHHLLGRSIDRAGCGRDRKFKPLVLGEIQAAGDIRRTKTIAVSQNGKGSLPPACACTPNAGCASVNFGRTRFIVFRPML